MTGTFTPSTARDLHRNLIEWWGSLHAQQWANEVAEFCDPRPPAPPGDGLTAFYAFTDPVAEQRRLRAAETFLVTDEMSAVCRHAAASLPTLVVEHAMLPAEVGFLVFNDRVTDHDERLGALVPLEAVMWWPAQYEVGGRPASGVAVATFASPDVIAWIMARLTMIRTEQATLVEHVRQLEERLDGVDADEVPTDSALVIAAGVAEHQAATEEYDRRRRVIMQYRMPMMPALFTFLPYGQEPGDEALEDDEIRYAARMLVSAWLLMGQPIAGREHPRIDRPAAKRAVRAGLTSNLTVVTLRQPRHAPTGLSPSREYHTRWIVRGHWRRIPTPDQPGRVTWVHGYVKGPTGAPLVVRDRVTVLAR
jgi:hypothetical protein